jgi:hypothetical protein
MSTTLHDATPQQANKQYCSQRTKIISKSIMYLTSWSISWHSCIIFWEVSSLILVAQDG